MTETKNDLQAVEKLKDAHKRIKSEIAKVIVGQDKVVEQLLIALLSSGHCLLVGVPGLAKTLLISTLANILDLKFNRIQFTPDLMPSDITGTEIIEEDKSVGTRSLRLQAMQEHEVTAAGQTYTLDEPFFVLATQNPIEQEGTYPLPEAQLDRFMFNVYVDYPSHEEEQTIVRTTTVTPSYQLDKILDAKEIIDLQQLVRRVPVSDHLIGYAVDIVRATRPENGGLDFIKNWVSWGAGPRASQYLILAAKTRAILDGRPTPGPEDVRFAALPVLRHRIVTSFNAEADGVDTIAIVNKLLESVKEKS